MKGIVSRLAEVSEKMKRTTSMFDSRFAEIEAIDGQYSLERRGRAEKLAKEFNNMLALGAWARAGKDEAELMKNSTATPDGKKVAVNFSMPRQTVVDMINKQLKPGV